jgi:hypothetical protein
MMPRPGHIPVEPMQTGPAVDKETRMKKRILVLLHLGKLPVQASGEYAYNSADDTISPEHICRLSAKFLFPGPG